MSISVTFSGQSFTIPSQAERNWATTLNAYLVALSANALPRSGGSFTLAADLDLGATANLYVKGLISKSAGPSTTGYVRLANNEGLGWRNAAGTSDLILKVNASNQLEYNGAPLASGATAVTLTGAQTVQDKTFTNVASMTFAAGGSLDWASGSMSIGATVGPNTMTLGGAATSVYVAGFLKSKILTTDDDKVYINNDAASTGADWKAILQRPVAGMVADATYTFPTVSTILVGRDTTDTLSNKILSAPTITSPSITNPSITTAASLTGVATPSTPAAGIVKIYAKTDDKIYKITSAGVESEIGAGGGLVTDQVTALPATLVRNTSYPVSQTATTNAALPVTALDTVIEVTDALGACSTTNEIGITAGAGQSIRFRGSLITGTDRFVMRRPNVTARFSKEPGSSIWDVAYQTVATQTPGLQTGYTGSTAIGAGYIGEKVTGQTLRSANISLVTVTPKTVVTINIPSAGVWLLSGQAGFVGSATATAGLRMEISQTSDTQNAPPSGVGSGLDESAWTLAASCVLNNSDTSGALSPIIVTTTAAKTYYAVAYANFSGGTAAGYGRLQAVRIA